MAVLRYIFMPLYAQWWVKQTSPNAFGLLFVLYVAQMINWAFYTLNVNRLDQNDDGDISLTHTDRPNQTTKGSAAGDKTENEVSHQIS